MRLLNQIAALAALITLAASSCAGPDSPSAPEAPEAEIVVTLRIPAGEGTRSAPAASAEGGDGREQGLPDENAVGDAHLFFFAGTSLNDDPSTSVSHVYTDELPPAADDSSPLEKVLTIRKNTNETTLQADGILTAPNVSFITVLNAGPDPALAAVRTLGELRAYTGLEAQRKGLFVMTTAFDNPPAAMGVKGDNRLRPESVAGKTEWRGEATVQRLAARIDVAFTSAYAEEASPASPSLRYSTPSGCSVALTGILPVNVSGDPSYLLAKVSNGIPDWAAGTASVTWAGTQTAVAGEPANCVLDPRTFGRTLSACNYDFPAADAVSMIADPSKGEPGSFTAVTISEGSLDRALIIGYANENVPAPSDCNHNFLTGLILRASYTPKGWTAPATFWRYLPSRYGDGEMADSNALYFHSKEEADAYASAHPADLPEITEFKDGTCYYNVWLRHFNTAASGSEPDAPMQYAIVRNNIYRVWFEFTGPGDPIPSLREPSTLKSRIFVRPWNLRTENTMTF